MAKFSKTIGARELPDDYYILIGKILVHWGWLEYRTHEATWNILPTNRKTARMVTSELGMRALTNVLISLTGRRIRNRVGGRVRDLASKINSNLDKRNHFVHGVWKWDGEKATALEYRGKPVEGNPHHYNRKQLTEFLRQIDQKRSRLQELLDRADIGEPPPSPDKRAKRAQQNRQSHRPP